MPKNSSANHPEASVGSPNPDEKRIRILPGVKDPAVWANGQIVYWTTMAPLDERREYRDHRIINNGTELVIVFHPAHSGDVLNDHTAISTAAALNIDCDSEAGSSDEESSLRSDIKDQSKSGPSSNSPTVQQSSATPPPSSNHISLPVSPLCSPSRTTQRSSAHNSPMVSSPTNSAAISPEDIASPSLPSMVSTRSSNPKPLGRHSPPLILENPPHLSSSGAFVPSTPSTTVKRPKDSPGEVNVAKKVKSASSLLVPPLSSQTTLDRSVTSSSRFVPASASDNYSIYSSSSTRPTSTLATSSKSSSPVPTSLPQVVPAISPVTVEHNKPTTDDTNVVDGFETHSLGLLQAPELSARKSTSSISTLTPVQASFVGGSVVLNPSSSSGLVVAELPQTTLSIGSIPATGALPTLPPTPTELSTDRRMASQAVLPPSTDFSLNEHASALYKKLPQNEDPIDLIQLKPSQNIFLNISPSMDLLPAANRKRSPHLVLAAKHVIVFPRDGLAYGFPRAGSLGTLPVRRDVLSLDAGDVTGAVTLSGGLGDEVVVTSSGQAQVAILRLSAPPVCFLFYHLLPLCSKLC